jgi:hypothetical protein
MIPQLVLFPETEEEVMRIMNKASEKHVAVTFRAAAPVFRDKAYRTAYCWLPPKNGKVTGFQIMAAPFSFSGDCWRTGKPDPPALGRKFAPDPASVPRL